MRSAAIRTVVNGVRSSWLTSEVNRRCRLPNSSRVVICRCRLSAISLKDTASRAISSSPRTGIRSDRCPSAKRSAIREADRTGRTTCRDTSNAMPANSSNRTIPPVAMVPRTRVMVFSSLVSGKIRYSSRLLTRDGTGVPTRSAGPENPSVRTVAYW